MSSRIEIVGVFSGRTSGISVLHETTVFATGRIGRTPRKVQIQRAINFAPQKPNTLIPTARATQDAKYPAYKQPL